MQEGFLTLSALNTRIRNATSEAFPEALWVIAEILEMQVNRSGHCYMELIEKSDTDDSIKAKSRATIWSFKYKMIRPYFEAATGSLLQPGIKVLLRSEVTFHEIYGLSLNVLDIDPSYTMGDIALRKREVIRKLNAAGVMQMNRELELEEVPQRIAVISSETAAGFGDFIDSIVNNNYNFGFKISLFPAIVQGELAERSIISALENVFRQEDSFDAVVIIRGGGSQSDLDCFNAFELAMNIAQFPIPVITGIGHERDETIADMVAYKSLKTPTAVAEFLIDRIAGFSERLTGLQARIEQAGRWIIQQESMVLKQRASDMNYLVQQYLVGARHMLKDYSSVLEITLSKVTSQAGHKIDHLANRLLYTWKGLSERRKRDLELFEKHIRSSGKAFLLSLSEQVRVYEKSLELMRPEKVLSRGYSITYSDGKIVKSISGLTKGTKIITSIKDGLIHSEIEKIDKNK